MQLRSLIFISTILLTLWSCTSPKPDNVSIPQGERFVARGRELVRGLAACGVCHGQDASPDSPLVGGRAWKDIYGLVNAPNITSHDTGIGNWNVDQIVGAIRGSEDKDKKELSPDAHRGFEWMSDDDALAIISYLRAVPGLPNFVERREIGIIERNTVGILTKRRYVKGFVPAVKEGNEIERGRYLTDHVARCGVCHNSEATFLTGEGYLFGGKEVPITDKTYSVPGLRGSAGDPNDSWKESEIVAFLRGGMLASGTKSEGCPTRFYVNASERDLLAIAKYIKSLPKS